MILNLRYFYEKTDENFHEYNKIWDENKERMIFFQTNLRLKDQVSCITDYINDNKDILAIRFPSNTSIKRNKIINNIISGKGFNYDGNKIWYPKEVWIYN